MNIKWIILSSGISLIALMAIVLAVFSQFSANTKSDLLASAEVMSSQIVSGINNDHSTSVAALATAEWAASQANSALNNAQSTSTANLATVEVAAIQTISAHGNLQSTSAKSLADANARYDVALTAQAENVSLSKAQESEISTQAARISVLEKANICQYIPDTIDYSSSRAASNSIKAWLEETEGMIDEANWNPLWQNTKVNMHFFTSKEDAFYVFIVYFDDEEHTNAVFDVYNNCWLDR